MSTGLLGATAAPRVATLSDGRAVRVAPLTWAAWGELLGVIQSTFLHTALAGCEGLPDALRREAIAVAFEAAAAIDLRSDTARAILQRADVVEASLWLAVRAHADELTRAEFSALLRDPANRKAIEREFKLAQGIKDDTDGDTGKESAKATSA